MVENQNKPLTNKQVLVSAKKQEFESDNKKQSIQVDPTSQVKAVGMYFNFDKADRFWEKKHGIVLPTIELNDVNGNRYDNGKWKAIIQRDLFLNQVSRDYVVYPNEEVIDIANNLIKQDPSLKMLGEPHFTNHGLNMYITIVSEKHRIKIDGSYQENDYVNLGVIIRNSLGGGLALGTDLFTYRYVCQNGAVFGYEDLGSDSMRHYGKNTAKITELMRQTITNGLSKFEDIHQYYEKLATTPLGEKSHVFKALEPWIAMKDFPSYVDIDYVKLNPTDKGKGDKVYSYSKSVENKSLWEVFNDFTQSIWHSKSMRLEAKKQQTMKLHKILIDTAYKKYN